jgi:DNA-binding GntR family transcriptional regulator
VSSTDSLPFSPATGTSVERAYAALREMLVQFAFKPGERLNEVEIARRLDMSRAPVREAMNRLVSERLLTFVPNQGFSCRRLSASETAALYEVRADLESAAALGVPAAAAPEAIAELRRYWMSVTAEQGTAPVAALVARDEEFHLRLAELAGNAERVRLLRDINARVQFVRLINLEDPARLRQAFAEHAEIVAKLAAGDGAGAAAVMRRHLTLSAEQAAASVRQGLARIYADSVE